MTTEVVVDNIPLMKFRGPGAAVYVGQTHTLGSLSLSFCLSFSFFVGLLTFCIPLCVSVFSLCCMRARAYIYLYIYIYMYIYFVVACVRAACVRACVCAESPKASLTYHAPCPPFAVCR